MKILVIDDQRTIHRIIQALFEEHSVVSAYDGKQGLTMFKQYMPNIVLMDVNMPVLGGLECCQQIKEFQNQVTWFAPVIFMTGMEDDSVLTQCLSVGGDDFVQKPINLTQLKAKVLAHQRTVNLYLELSKQKQEMATLNNRLEQEHQMGQAVMSNAMKYNLNTNKCVKTYVAPLGGFNGDIVLTAPRPFGGMYMLVADFTGHGLAAAMGAIPLSQVFVAMTRKSLGIGLIAEEINKTLMNFLPGHMFCACSIFEINEKGTRLEVWAGGLPTAYIVRPGAGIIDVIFSKNLPLGADVDTFSDELEVFDILPGDKILVSTDGIIESTDSMNRFYGTHRLEEIIRANPNQPFESLLHDHQSFISDWQQRDDVTLLEVTSQDFPPFNVEVADDECRVPWNHIVVLGVTDLQNSKDFVSYVVNNLAVNDSLFMYNRSNVHDIISELCSNSLEHGLLKLDSTMKDTFEGFKEYYRMRDARLRQLKSGFINLEIKFNNQTEELTIVVEDSGSGFDLSKICFELGDITNSYGRGIALVKALCKKVDYYMNGAGVRAVYQMQRP